MKSLSMIISDEMWSEFQRYHAQNIGIDPEIAKLHRMPESHARELMFRAVQGYLNDGRAETKKSEEGHG
jgi:hypothetical protein